MSWCNFFSHDICFMAILYVPVTRLPLYCSFTSLIHPSIFATNILCGKIWYRCTICVVSYSQKRPCEDGVTSVKKKPKFFSNIGYRGKILLKYIPHSTSSTTGKFPSNHILGKQGGKFCAMHELTNIFTLSSFSLSFWSYFFHHHPSSIFLDKLRGT